MNFKKIGLIALVIVILSVVGLYLIASYVNVSEGYRAGRIVKMSHKGLAIKTWEGQLQTGAATDGPGGIWSFSVLNSDEQVRKDIESAIDHDHRVKLYYDQKLWKISWRGETDYFVNKVELIGH
jgi:hypothetical protein